MIRWFPFPTFGLWWVFVQGHVAHTKDQVAHVKPNLCPNCAMLGAEVGDKFDPARLWLGQAALVSWLFIQLSRCRRFSSRSDLNTWFLLCCPHAPSLFKGRVSPVVVHGANDPSRVAQPDDVAWNTRQSTTRSHALLFVSSFQIPFPAFLIHTIAWHVRHSKAARKGSTGSTDKSI